jgi:CheY-like chemotaxis protein
VAVFLQVVEQLRADPKTRDVPVIMLTAKSDEETMAKGLPCASRGAAAATTTMKPSGLATMGTSASGLLVSTQSGNGSL